jgi:hypothetical protein
LRARDTDRYCGDRVPGYEHCVQRQWHLYAWRNPDTDADSDGLTDLDTDGNADGHTVHSDADTDRDPGHSDTEPDRKREPNGFAKREPEPGLEGNQPVDSYAGSDG